MKNRFSLDGKVIVVTGGTGVLGQAFTTAIAQGGGIVGILGRNKSVAEERADIIIKHGGKAIALIADVTSEQQLIEARDKTIKTFGKIDGLVNAAGGNVPEAVVQPESDLFSINVDGMKKAMDVNLWGTVLPTLVFGKSMAEKKAGSIVNISSVSATRTLTKVLGYSLGKASVEMFTKWFAVEMAKRYGDAVRMNALMPGFFLTEQNKTLLTNTDGSFTQRGQSVINHTPFNRFGNPEELAGALIWLLSDASKFVTGTTITVDGGFNSFSGV